MFDFKPTKKGPLRAEFRDRFGAVCSIQESSFPDEDCIWVGIEVDMDGSEVARGRMHLTQAMAKELIPVLRHFARTGKLGEDDADLRFQIGTWVRGVSPENRHVAQGRVVQMNAGTAILVQDAAVPGNEGLHITRWDTIDLLWEVIDMPEHIPSRYDRLAADDDDSV